ncbi:uncharacterized protein V6R79_004736 [Siganus canaliculatus]
MAEPKAEEQTITALLAQSPKQSSGEMTMASGVGPQPAMIMTPQLSVHTRMLAAQHQALGPLPPPGWGEIMELESRLPPGLGVVWEPGASLDYSLEQDADPWQPKSSQQTVQTETRAARPPESINPRLRRTTWVTRDPFRADHHRSPTRVTQHPDEPGPSGVQGLGHTSRRPGTSHHQGKLKNNTTSSSSSSEEESPRYYAPPAPSPNHYPRRPTAGKGSPEPFSSGIANKVQQELMGPPAGWLDQPNIPCNPPRSRDKASGQHSILRRLNITLGELSQLTRAQFTKLKRENRADSRFLTYLRQLGRQRADAQKSWRITDLLQQLEVEKQRSQHLHARLEHYGQAIQQLCEERDTYKRELSFIEGKLSEAHNAPIRRVYASEEENESYNNF